MPLRDARGCSVRLFRLSEVEATQAAVLMADKLPINKTCTVYFNQYYNPTPWTNCKVILLIFSRAERAQTSTDASIQIS